MEYRFSDPQERKVFTRWDDLKKFLKKHLNIPIANMVVENDQVYLINKFSGVRHKFTNGSDCINVAQTEWIPKIFELMNHIDLIRLEKERMSWSLKAFPKATAISSLYKLEEEIREIKTDIENQQINPEEYVDALMCLLDSAGRQGITIEQILTGYSKKFEINKKRKWKLNPDNSYSHVK